MPWNPSSRPAGLGRSASCQFCPPPLIAQVTPLLENFRTHGAISRLAHQGVLEPLLHFFPTALDKLPPEDSALKGMDGCKMGE